jgi:hypothetical protein
MQVVDVTRSPWTTGPDASGLYGAGRRPAVGVRPLGLVPVADAHGKPPKPLKEPAAPHFRRRAPRLGTPRGMETLRLSDPGPGHVAVHLCTTGSRPQPHHLGERACLI